MAETASRRQPGTDFSILACAELLSYMLSSIAGGFIAKQLGFSGLFAVGSVLALVCWWATWYLLRHQPVVASGVAEGAA